MHAGVVAVYPLAAAPHKAGEPYVLFVGRSSQAPSDRYPSECQRGELLSKPAKCRPIIAVSPPLSKSLYREKGTAAQKSGQRQYLKTACRVLLTPAWA